MKKYLLGLVLLGLTSIGYADYNWASWYNLNPTIGSLSITGNATSGQTLTTKHLVVTSSVQAVSANIGELNLTAGCTVATVLKVTGLSRLNTVMPDVNRNFIIAPLAQAVNWSLYNSNTIHGLSDNPTLFVHSNNDPTTNSREWFSVTHNGANSVISSTGTSNGFVFRPGNTNVYNSTWTATGLDVSGYVRGNLIQTGVQYSTITITIPFISTGVTTASMIGQVVDVPCIGSDYIVKSWCANANTAGTFTVTLSTAIFANTPSYGNSIMQNSSPNLVSTVASSGTVTGAGTVPSGGFLRATCNTATLVDMATVGIQVWIRK